MYFPLTVGAILSVLLLQAQEPKWELRKQDDGISIYTRDIPNVRYKEVKSMMVLETSLSGMVALITDIAGFVDWSANCVHAEVIKTEGDSVWYGYTQTSLPWPLSNRDICFRLSVSQDSVSKVVTTASVARPDLVKRSGSLVRITHSETHWKLTPIKAGVVQMEYTALFDPGGNMPAWLANLTLVSAPFGNCQRVRDRIVMEKYQQAKFGFIQELE